MAASEFGKQSTDINGRGGPRLGAGRPSGSQNKTTAAVRELASEHGPKAIERLAWLMTNAENQATQVAAARELLERAYGKSTQILGNDPDNPVAIPTVIRIQIVDPLRQP